MNKEALERSIKKYQETVNKFKENLRCDIKCAVIEELEYLKDLYERQYIK